jgi:biopolymer transport protein ExbD
MEVLRPKKINLSLDMAPLIDVVFQLLIFFMLTSSFSNPALKLDLPKAAEHDQKSPEVLVLSVDKRGTIYVNREQIALDDLKPKLSLKLSHLTDKSIHLQGDKEMPYGLFVQIMDIGRQAGAKQIHVVHTADPS